MKKAKLTTFPTSIQYCTRSSSYCSNAKGGIKEGREGRIKGEDKEREGGVEAERDKGRKLVKEGHKNQKGRSKTLSLSADNHD